MVAELNKKNTVEQCIAFRPMAEMTSEELVREHALLRGWMQALSQSTPCNIWIKDEEGAYSLVNANFCELIGKAPNELIAAAPEQIFDAERAARAREIDAIALNEGSTRRTVPCGPDGDLRLHDETRFPITDENDSIIGIGCFALEVTEANFRQIQLAKAETMGNMVSWRWSTANQLAGAVTGPVDAVLGVGSAAATAQFEKRFELIQDPHERSRVQIRLLDAQRQGTGYTIQYELSRPDGSIAFLTESGVPVLNAVGEISEYVGIIRDDTLFQKQKKQLLAHQATLEELIMARTAQLQEALDAAELAHDKASALALLDPLTGALNRRGLFDAVEKLPSEMASTVLVFDVDYFKQVNDLHGHRIGDAYLTRFVESVAERFGRHHPLARLGGTQFVLVLPCDGDNASRESGRQLLQFSRTFKLDLGGEELRRTVSIGIAELVQGGEFLTALKEADFALLKAKRDGRDCLKLFDDQLRKELAEQLLRPNDQELRAALHAGQIRYHLQPIKNSKTGRFQGAEALLRWERDDGQVIAPAKFLGEYYAFTTAADRGLSRFAVIERFLAELSVAEVDIEFISFNITKTDLLGEVCARFLADVEKLPWPAHKIILELVEEGFGAADDLDYLAEILASLSASGYRLALDDFGVNASNLERLASMPISMIKLDRFLLANATEKKNASLLRAMRAMARELDLDLVAEGVETEEQCEFLTGLGISIQQGYLHGRPMPLNQFPRRG